MPGLSEKRNESRFCAEYFLYVDVYINLEKIVMNSLNYGLLVVFLMLMSMLPANSQPVVPDLKITQVFVDNSADPTTFLIVGTNFTFGPGPLVATLGDAGPLTINSVTDTLIDAEISGPIVAGDYLLLVSTGIGNRENDEYDLTIAPDVAALQDAVCDLQAGVGGPLSASCGRKLVFLTSAVFQPRTGFQGLAGADQICQNLASTASLAGTYMAWISDSTTSPSDRFTQSDEPYALVNGMVVAENYDDLTDGALHNPITVTEAGGVVTSTPVWTGTLADGTRISPDSRWYCLDWTSNFSTTAYFGRVGTAGSNTGTWSSSSTQPCNNSFRLYCFEQ